MPRGIPNKPKNTEREVEIETQETGLRSSRGDDLDGGIGSERRSPRVSLSGGGKLAIPDDMKEEGYFYYWAIDKPGELDRFEAAWYEFVTDKYGKKITRPAGRGDTHYLMRIAQELYDKDMAEQQARVNEGLKKSAQVDSKEGQYLPEGREGVLERDVLV